MAVLDRKHPLVMWHSLSPSALVGCSWALQFREPPSPRARARSYLSAKKEEGLATERTAETYMYTLMPLALFSSHIPQDNLRTVSEATAAENGFDLRPGENLGVRLGLFRDGLNLENRLTRAVSERASVLFKVRCRRATTGMIVFAAEDAFAGW